MRKCTIPQELLSLNLHVFSSGRERGEKLKKRKKRPRILAEKTRRFSTGHATDAFKVSERRRRKGLEDQPLNGHTPDTLEIIIGSFPEKVNDPLRDQLRWPIILTILLLCLSLVGLSV